MFTSRLLSDWVNQNIYMYKHVNYNHVKLLSK